MNSKPTMIASISAGIGASLCCLAPLVLLSLGLSGARVANFAALEPVRRVFAGLSFRNLYLTTPTGESGRPCADVEVICKQRFIFWGATIILLDLLAFP